MKRNLLILLALAAVLTGAPLKSASAEGFGRGHGNGASFGIGVGGYSDIFGYAELYRELYNNLPYFALHPPVYYSYPVPRTYGYSPFAYPGSVMTPEVSVSMQPLEISNPYVPVDKSKPGTTQAPANDRAAKIVPVPQPLMIVNPFVSQGQAIAQADVR